VSAPAAIEYGQYGIRVNAVSPGAVRTDMLLQVFGSEQAIDRLAAVHPLGRIGNPEEIADAVIWLFSDNSSYYTGQSLTLDGGLTAQRPVTGQPVSSDNEKSPALASPFEDRRRAEDKKQSGNEKGNGWSSGNIVTVSSMLDPN
jgi:hypothetical protein